MRTRHAAVAALPLALASSLLSRAAAAPLPPPPPVQPATFTITALTAGTITDGTTSTGLVRLAGGLAGTPTHLQHLPVLAPEDARGSKVAAISLAGGDEESAGVVLDTATGRLGVHVTHTESVALSGDSRTLYLVSQPRGGNGGPSYLESVPVTGGPVRRIVGNPAGRELQSVAVSQDGRTAFVCASTPLLGGSEADFARLRAPNLIRVDLRTHAASPVRLQASLGAINCDSITPSPDGRTLAIGMQTTQGDEPYVNLVDLTTGRVRRLGGSSYRDVTGWTADSSHVYVTLAFPTSRQQLSLVSVATGRGTAVPKVGGQYVDGVFPARSLA